MKTKIYIGLLSLLSVNIFAQDKQEKTVLEFDSLSIYETKKRILKWKNYEIEIIETEMQSLKMKISRNK